jgi:putative membrane protein
MKLLLKWLLSAAALLLVAYLYSGVQVDSINSALIAPLVIGRFNTSLIKTYPSPPPTDRGRFA